MVYKYEEFELLIEAEKLERKPKVGDVVLHHSHKPARIVTVRYDTVECTFDHPNAATYPLVVQRNELTPLTKPTTGECEVLGEFQRAQAVQGKNLESSRPWKVEPRLRESSSASGSDHIAPDSMFGVHSVFTTISLEANALANAMNGTRENPELWSQLYVARQALLWTLHPDVAVNPLYVIMNHRVISPADTRELPKDYLP